MLLSELGEFGLIARLERILARSRRGAAGDEQAERGREAHVLIGPGDDAALVAHRGRRVLITCDSAIEGRHFDLSICSPADAGYRAMAGAISDIAAMGGQPTCALVSLALPRDLPVESAEGLIEGAAQAAADAGCAIAGGDCVGSLQGIGVHVTVIGEPVARRLLVRSAAKPGDKLLLTGPLGDSAAGLALLQGGDAATGISAAAKAYLTRRHLRPRPRLAFAQTIARMRWARCCIDVSDGLLQDLGHICERSGVKATVRLSDVPVSQQCGEAAAALDASAQAWALSGGEDYELLLSVSARNVDKIYDMLKRAALPDADDELSGLRPAVIGEVSRGEGVVLLDAHGQPMEPERIGWDHFRARD
ncbi:MAG: thiamine-phosphate kinase [Armatimonadota bacterium]